MSSVNETLNRKSWKFWKTRNFAIFLFFSCAGKSAATSVSRTAMELPRKLITLPEGTCCRRAAVHWLQTAGQGVILEAVPNFLAGRERLESSREGKNVWLLIPDISEINPVLTKAQGWEWAASFPLANPPLHFARGQVVPAPSKRSRRDSLPALRTLLEYDERFRRQYIDPARDIIEWREVGSTLEAATNVAGGAAEFCITNQMCLDRFGLVKLLQLKQMTIVWKLFYFNP